MTTMTWNDFVAHVNAELERQGSHGNDPIARIQIALPQNNQPYKPEVHLGTGHGIIIDGGLIT